VKERDVSENEEVAEEDAEKEEEEGEAVKVAGAGLEAAAALGTPLVTSPPNSLRLAVASSRADTLPCA